MTALGKDVADGKGTVDVGMEVKGREVGDLGDFAGADDAGAHYFGGYSGLNSEYLWRCAEKQLLE